MSKTTGKKQEGSSLGENRAAAEKAAAEKAAVKKIKILLPVAGRFMLPYNVAQVVEVGEKGVSPNQAIEMIELGYAKKA